MTPTFVVNSPEAVREILVRHDQSFSKGRTTTVLERTVGEVVLTTEGERHAVQKNIQPAFYKESLERYAYAIIDETKKSCETLRTAIRNNRVEPSCINLCFTRLFISLCFVPATVSYEDYCIFWSR